MVVHLLLINEHFLVWNLCVNGNGNGFSRTLESNIWDYIICSCVEVSRKVCDVLLGCWNIPAMASQRYDPYQLHFIFCIDNWIECYFADSLSSSVSRYISELQRHCTLLCFCLVGACRCVWSPFWGACWGPLVWGACAGLCGGVGFCLAASGRHNENDRCT